MYIQEDERLRFLINALITSRIVFNDADFAEQIGKSTGMVSQVASGKKRMSKQMGYQILNTFPMVNKVFLETGKGDPLIIEKAPIFRGDIRYWVDIDATGGGLVSFDDVNTSEYRKIDIQIPEFRDCTDAINLYGDSMAPRYKPGQIIILKEWTESFIEYGNVYLIITANGNRMVKQLKKAQEESHILCVSFNPDFDSFSVSRDDIKKLFVVKGAIEKSTL